MQEQYHILNIKNISKQVSTNSKQLTTIGIIIDASNPHRKDTKKDYCMRLKIIDSSSTHTPCHVFLYNKNKQDFPNYIKIGDILFLHRYNFDTWNDSLQAKKPFKDLAAFVRFFAGNPQNIGYNPIDNEVGLNDSQGKILNGINQCRKFSKTYFKNNAVPLFSKNGKQSSDFDLILQVNQSKESLGCYKIEMTNSVNDFQLKHSNSIAPGVYKVRSIANLSWKDKKCQLIGNDYTYFLEISNWMKSYEQKEWQKIAVGKQKVSGSTRQYLSTKILHEGRGDKRKQVSLADLINKDFHEEEVKVSCQFMQVFSPFERALKKYDSINHTQKSYESESGEYIYNIHMALSDKSLEGEIFNVYIYTFDNRGLQFLPELDTKQIYGKNILAYREKYDNLMNRLLQETEIDSHPLEIILSPMFNGRQTIYRIVDTELLI